MYDSAMPKPQSFKNHTRWDPPMHFFVFPVLLVNIGFSIWYLVRHWPAHPHLGVWMIVMAIALFLLAGGARSSALRAQDRLIRLEERLRMAAVLPAGELAASAALTTKQLIALRFASDGELPGLVARTLTGNLTPKQIKEAIVSWRPDYERV